MKKFTLAIVIGIMIISSTVGFSYSEDQSTTISIYDRKFEPGLLDKSRLPKSERDELEKRTAEIDEYFNNMKEQEANIKFLKHKLSNETIADEIESLNRIISKKEKELKDLELNIERDLQLSKIKNESKDRVEILSSSSDVDLDVNMYEDIMYPGQFVIQGNADWLNSN